MSNASLLDASFAAQFSESDSIVRFSTWADHGTLRIISVPRSACLRLAADSDTIFALCSRAEMPHLDEVITCV